MVNIVGRVSLPPWCSQNWDYLCRCGCAGTPSSELRQSLSFFSAEFPAGSPPRYSNGAALRDVLFTLIGSSRIGVYLAIIALPWLCAK